MDALKQDWGLTLSSQLSGGTEALVVAATTRAGEDAVLKLVIPGLSSASSQLRVLLTAQGRGYVRVLQHDESRGATLLERLGPRLSEVGLTPARQMEVLCRTLVDAWQVPPTEAFLSGKEKALSLARLIEELWSEHMTSCPRHVVETALRYTAAREAAFTPDTSILAHGDCHADNALRVRGDDAQAFKFIDPDGIFIERGYDLGILMREWSEDLLEGDAFTRGIKRCQQLSMLTGVAPTAIWQWGFIERVSTGLYLQRLGLNTEATEVLDVAAAWAAHPDPF
ncbi:phosphotransferase [Myxococcus sp. AM001]|nr:phosphotransferase [Myxococcus sp. AM001]